MKEEEEEDSLRLPALGSGRIMIVSGGTRILILVVEVGSLNSADAPKMIYQMVALTVTYLQE